MVRTFSLFSDKIKKNKKNGKTLIFDFLLKSQIAQKFRNFPRRDIKDSIALNKVRMRETE